jgi:hypothetical protein
MYSSGSLTRPLTKTLSLHFIARKDFHMRIRVVVLCVAMYGTLFTTAAADETGKPLSVPTVGSVYGKPVNKTDIRLTEKIDTSVEFDSRDTDRWEQMGRIQKAFGGPVLERFVEQHKIEVSADEIKTFQNASRKTTERKVREQEAKLAELKKKLTSSDLSNEEKAKIMAELATHERLVEILRQSLSKDTPDRIARSIIAAWKTERELYRRYGGRVIFQQFGLEALDARRKLFEEAENKGDIKFDDNGVRHLFYYYSNMKHLFVDKEEAAKMLEQPWFFSNEK